MSRAPLWNEITAVFGGSFDPPHLGHRQAVRGLFERPGIKNVLILPTPSPAYKPCTAQVQDRLEMAKLCFAADAEDPGFPPQVTFDLREIERAKREPGRPTYSFDTLTEMRREIPKLAFVVGTDQLKALKTWHRFPEVLSLCHWIVLVRKPDGLAPAHLVLSEWEASGLVKKSNDLWQIRGSESWLVVMETQAMALSSTRVREAMGRDGTPKNGTLLRSVSSYLMDRGLYGTRVRHDE